jgi:formamidopyrimidine-DNA glycosylase
VGRSIERVEVRWARTAGGTPARLVRGAGGTRVVALQRRAKLLRFDLEREGAPAGALLCHLRMTGRLHVTAGDVAAGDYTRVRLALDDGRWLVFDDVRKFGRFTFAPDPAHALRDLGPEPLEPGFDGTWLADALRARRRALKPLLLDQSFLAGLGNIYVDEALHRAGLHPRRRSHRVAPDAAGRLATAIQEILRAAIAREGSSFDVFYRTPDGRPGAFQDELRVYDRAGEPCRTCATPIRRIVVGQRGTHLCPRCQR